MIECRHCSELKPEDAYPANRRTTSGKSPWCKSCHAEAGRLSRERERVKVAALKRLDVELGHHEILARTRQGVKAHTRRA
jgi:hypothetical protein